MPQKRFFIYSSHNVRGNSADTLELWQDLLYHTAFQLTAAMGKRQGVIRAALGWKQEATQEGYTQFSAEDLQDLRLE